MTSLIVPVDVVAYCVGTTDHHGPVQHFAGGATDFRAQATAERAAYLGSNVVRGADQAPLWTLDIGVHVHWAMPDALTRATGDAATFPALPNRWLVTRIVGAGVSSRHWVVESDTLSTTPPAVGQVGPTLPVQVQADGTDAVRGYRYLGSTTALDDWQERLTATDRPLLTLTGRELHAASTGEVAFTAYYPDCRGVFGLWDDFSDLDDAPVDIAYSVVGWYDLATNDPLAAGPTPTALQQEFGWTYTADTGSAPTASLYHGFVQAIAWDSDTPYCADDAPVDARVAVGNSPGEALAVWLRGMLPDTLPTAFEELMTLYAAGLLPELADPGADQLALLEEGLHALQFAAIDGGTIYTLTQGQAKAKTLPLALADALNALNTAQQAVDLAVTEQTQARWQLFADWVRVFKVDDANQQAALNAFAARQALQAAIDANVLAATTARDTVRLLIDQLLPTGLLVTSVPAARYQQAAEPVVLLAGDAATRDARHGGDGRFDPDGYLVCRLDSQLLTALSIGDVRLTASTYSSLAPASPELPAAAAALVEEAALLEGAIGASVTTVPAPELVADLATWLAGGTAQHYRDPAGQPPSPVTANAWAGNPRASLMLLWEADFHPLLDTGVAGTDYATDFFTADYRLDPDAPRSIAYAPTSAGITVDPATIDFDPLQPHSGTYQYKGRATLFSTSATNLRTRILKDTDASSTLQHAAALLGETPVALRNLSGLNDALLSRERALQLSIGIAPDQPIPFRLITTQLQQAVTTLAEIPPLSPHINGSFSGVRAGYMRLTLRVMDAFGCKRRVNALDTFVADTMVTQVAGQSVPGVIYLQPRLTQPTRLLWRWLAADGTDDDEMNDHPATTPVCGWLLPSHLGVGFAFYDAVGNPLGSLTLRDDKSGIIWQSAPGDQATVGMMLAQVMADQNAELRAVATTLGDSTPARFEAIWSAIDIAVTQVSPPAGNSGSSLALLVGRPLAIVQAALTLQRQGLPALDQTLAALDDGVFTDTDHAVGGINFPVVIGDLKRLDDGLVGYFRDGTGGYKTDIFYTQAATGDVAGVARPAVDSLLLTAQAVPADAPATLPGREKLLMLVDPRAPVHATMGILPTLSLAIPPEQYQGALDALSIALPATPLLLPAGGPALPLPAVSGFTPSWITEIVSGGTPAWSIVPDVAQPTATALWQYSPQSLTEGWLRLNPDQLRVTLTADGQPVVTAGSTVTLALTIRNDTGGALVFTPGELIGEDRLDTGSVLYLHFGRLLDDAGLAALDPSAPGWQFAAYPATGPAQYWIATPTAAATLSASASLTITLTTTAISATSGPQTRIYVDYANLGGVPDGVEQALVTVVPPAS